MQGRPIGERTASCPEQTSALYHCFHACRRRPHSVVLLERVDRANPEAASLITQVGI